MDKAKQIANEHWEYLKGVLEVTVSGFKLPAFQIEAIGYHYRTAFVHGWKHALEEHGIFEKKYIIAIDIEDPRHIMFLQTFPRPLTKGVFEKKGIAIKEVTAQSEKEAIGKVLSLFMQKVLRKRPNVSGQI